jgi:uncharacterized protein YndB with AHSA1/START domain
MIEIERRIEARPEVVFAYFTDADRYTRWMGLDAELEARPGGIYRVQAPHGHYASGSFVVVEHPTRIVFTWGWEGDPEVPPGSSTVEVSFTGDGEATIVRLTHDGLPGPDAFAIHAQGWERYLGRLGIAATGGDPGPDRM